jgi:hypothetical protein
MFCVLSKTTVYGAFIFAEATVTGMTHLHMLKQPLMWSHLKEDFLEQLHFQQAGAPPCFHMAVKDFLDEIQQETWIG